MFQTANPDDFPTPRKAQRKVAMPAEDSEREGWGNYVEPNDWIGSAPTTHLINPWAGYINWPEEKTLSEDAASGDYLVTTNDWRNFAECARDYSVYVRDHTGTK